MQVPLVQLDHLVRQVQQVPLVQLDHQEVQVLLVLLEEMVYLVVPPFYTNIITMTDIQELHLHQVQEH